jgi:hypothetical protein
VDLAAVEDSLAAAEAAEVAEAAAVVKIKKDIQMIIYWISFLFFLFKNFNYFFEKILIFIFSYSKIHIMKIKDGIRW